MLIASKKGNFFLIFKLKIPKYIFLGCSSNTECYAPQPTCDIISQRCLGCRDLGCSLPREHCDHHSGRCVDKGLIFKNWVTRNKILKTNCASFFGDIFHIQGGEILVFFVTVSKNNSSSGCSSNSECSAPTPICRHEKCVAGL